MDKSDLWQETIDESGKSSIELHTPKVVQTWCNPTHHNFEFLGGNSRIAKCTICAHETPFIPGFHIIEKGKIKTAV